MPIYEFECPDCDVLFEERLSLAQLDEVVVECPICYAPRVKKVISAPTFLISRGRSNPTGAEIDSGKSVPKRPLNLPKRPLNLHSD